MMEFRNEAERWSKLQEFAQYLLNYVGFHARVAIRACIYYDFDNQSAEDYCCCPAFEDKDYPGLLVGLNGESEEICCKCPYYSPQDELKFAFSSEELEALGGFATGRGNSFDEWDEKLLNKLRNYISHAEAFEGGTKDE